MWVEIFGGMVSMILNPWLGMAFYRMAGFSFLFTFAVLLVREICYLVLAYRGFSWAILRVSQGRKGYIRKWIEKTRKRKENRPFVAIALNLLEKITEKTEKITRKIVNWITARSKKVCCMLAFIPIVPYLPTSVMISTKLMEIKHGFAILLFAMMFKAFICCALVYVLN